MLTSRPRTLDELAGLLERARSPLDVFGSDTEVGYRFLVKICHPNRFPPGPEQVKAAMVFRELTEWRKIALGAAVDRVVVSAKRNYALVKQLAAGDLSDVHLAVADGGRYVLKIARLSGINPLLACESHQLRALTAEAGGKCYRDYLPCLAETFRVPGANGDRQINAFVHRDGFYTLDAVRSRYRAGLDARHLAWIFKRILTVIGFASRCGLVHGAVLPMHVMLHAENHGAMLVDWIHATKIYSTMTFIPSAYRDWYPPEVLKRGAVGPATDIFMAAKCLIYAAGGDPIANRWPGSVPSEMQRFLDTCLFASPRMRPQDAWNLHEEFDQLLVRLFGPPKYHELLMS